MGDFLNWVCRLMNIDIAGRNMTSFYEAFRTDIALTR